MRQGLRVLALGVACIVLSAVAPTMAASAAPHDLADSHARAHVAGLPGAIETVTARGQERHCVVGRHPDLHCTVFDNERYVGLRGQHLTDGRYFYVVLT